MRQQDGFIGQRSIVIPDFILEEIKTDPTNQPLYITDIGYYPKAHDHYRTRLQGCSEHILIYCVDGKGWISINGQNKNVSSNQYFVIPQNEPHTYAADKNNPWSIFWIHFSGTHANFFVNDFYNIQSFFPSNIVRTEDRLQLFEEMILNLEMGYTLNNISYANVCLWHFLASFKFFSQYLLIRKTKKNDMIEQSVLFMKNHLRSKLSLKQLADQAGLSPSYYCAEFKRKTGRSPLEYLTHLKIQLACQLLDHSTLKIKEICDKVGYQDQYYFSRLFSQKMGLSPRLYRKNING